MVSHDMHDNTPADEAMFHEAMAMYLAGDATITMMDDPAMLRVIFSRGVDATKVRQKLLDVGIFQIPLTPRNHKFDAVDVYELKFADGVNLANATRMVLRAEESHLDTLKKDYETLSGQWHSIAEKAGLTVGSNGYKGTLAVDPQLVVNIPG